MTLIKLAEHPSSHRVLGNISLAVYENQDDQTQAIVLLFGKLIPGHDLPVRIQSACRYGDALDISDCDCGQQLEHTFGRFLEARKGILLYLCKEGYGAGLSAQAKARQVETEESVDHVEAYRRIGVLPDSQTYDFPLEILRAVGIHSFALLTNNLRKAEAATAAGFNAVRESIPIHPTADNLQFLETKQARLGQPLGLTEHNGDRSNSPSCFVIGSAVMDHVFEVRHNPSLGKTRQAERYRRRPGGKAFNQAVALSRLGANTMLLTVRGNDPDAAEISNVLATERVRGHYTGRPDGLRTPQTVVLQPPGRSPTYVGWLGEEHRLLHPQVIGQHLPHIEAVDAVVLTLETSESAVHQAVHMARANALVVLNASPIVEPPYELRTETLEHVDLLIGSREELAALVQHRSRTSASKSENALDVAQRLARLCNLTVIVTEFRAVHRWAMAVNPAVDNPVRVFGGDVRRIGVSDAIGTSDVFCAALTLQVLALPNGRRLPRYEGVWRDKQSPLASREALTDCVMLALGAEAYVARSRGGYKTFPRVGAEFVQWCREHPPRVEALDATLSAFR